MQTQKINGEWYVVDEKKGFIAEGATPTKQLWTEDIFAAQDFTKDEANKFIYQAKRAAHATKKNKVATV